MVIRAAVHRLQMYVGSGAASESVEEVVHQFGLQIADQTSSNFCVDDNRRPTAQVNGSNAKRFVHRHQKVAGSIDTFFIAQCAVESLAEGDANVFDRVVLVDIEVAFARQRQIEAAVAREQLEHVIEKTYAG